MPKTDQYSEDYARAYDAIYAEKNYLEEVRYVLDLLNFTNEGDSKVLEFGCGTGKHGSAMAERVNSVTGLEVSLEMISRGKFAKNFTVIQGDITQTFMNIKYDAVTSFFHVMCYLDRKDQRRLAFENANRHLDKGGYFFFDSWFKPAVANLVPETRIKKIELEGLKILRIAEPKSDPSFDCVEVNYSLFISSQGMLGYTLKEESHRMYPFSIEEVEELALQTGFELVLCEEFLTRIPPSKETWCVSFLLRKTNEFE